MTQSRFECQIHDSGTQMGRQSVVNLMEDLCSEMYSLRRNIDELEGAFQEKTEPSAAGLFDAHRSATFGEPAFQKDQARFEIIGYVGQSQGRIQAQFFV